MKLTFRFAIIALTIMLTYSLYVDAKTKKSNASRFKTASIEAIYNACVHDYDKKSCGLRLTNNSSGKYGGTGFYEREVYGINVKAIKKGTNLKFTATGPHAFYFQNEHNDTPTGLSLTFYYFGFSNKADCDKFCNLLRSDDIEIITPSPRNGWYELELNENEILNI